MSTHAPQSFVDFVKFLALWVWYEGNLVVKFFFLFPIICLIVFIWRKLRGKK